MTPAITTSLFRLLTMTSESHVLCHVPRMNRRMKASSTATSERHAWPGERSVAEGAGQQGQEKGVAA